MMNISLLLMCLIMFTISEQTEYEIRGVNSLDHSVQIMYTMASPAMFLRPTSLSIPINTIRSRSPSFSDLTSLRSISTERPGTPRPGTVCAVSSSYSLLLKLNNAVRGLSSFHDQHVEMSCIPQTLVLAPLGIHCHAPAPQEGSCLPGPAP